MKLIDTLYNPMHEVTPKVVAMAVSTVMTIWRIFPQISHLAVVIESDGYFGHTIL